MAGRGSSERRALIVATSVYGDPALSELQAPGHDANRLAAVLADPQIGDFEVETALEVPVQSLRRRIAHFCAEAAPGDLLLLYLSCHGLLDDRGRLYYATGDSDRELLSATAISSSWLNEQLEDCRSRRQVLLLDCCHSGAFAKGAKGAGSLALGARFEGRGRVVLTGSRAMEHSFERGSAGDAGASSVFTETLVQGLSSGEADLDSDGMVSVAELYEYAYNAVRKGEHPQTPTLWAYGAEGELMIARNPKAAAPAPRSPTSTAARVAPTALAGGTASSANAPRARPAIHRRPFRGASILAAATLLAGLAAGAATVALQSANSGHAEAGAPPHATASAGEGSSASAGVSATSPPSQMPTSTSSVRSTPAVSADGWPEGFSGYTVALASDVIRSDAVGAVGSARSAGLPAVGYVRSSLYRTLRPGYWFVFSGAYATSARAQAHVAAARQAGFRDAYVRFVAR